MQQGVQKTCNSNVWSCWPTMLHPVWDVMMLLHDDVTVVSRASAFTNWQFTYYNTHGSDWGTFALKTVFVLLSKQCIRFFSILLYCKSKPTSLWRWQHVKLLKLFLKTQQTENCHYTTDLLSSLLSTHPGSSERQDGRRFFRLNDLLEGKSRWSNAAALVAPIARGFFLQKNYPRCKSLVCLLYKAIKVSVV